MSGVFIPNSPLRPGRGSEWSLGTPPRRCRLDFLGTPTSSNENAPLSLSQEILSQLDDYDPSKTLFMDDAEDLLNRAVPRDRNQQYLCRKRKLQPIELVNRQEGDAIAPKTPLRHSTTSTFHDAAKGFQTPLCLASKYRANRLSTKEKHSYLLEKLNRELRKEFLATIVDMTDESGDLTHTNPIRITTVGSTSNESQQSLADDIAETANFRQIATNIFVSSQLVVKDGQYRKLLKEHSITDIINVASHCQPEFTDITDRGSKRRRTSYGQLVHCTEGKTDGDRPTTPITSALSQNETVSHHRIECVDEEDYPILQLDYDFFAELVDKILSTREKRKVLVHCVAGMNRSACLCVAYLVDRHGLDIRHAIRRVRGGDEVFAEGHVPRIVSSRRKANSEYGSQITSSQQYNIGSEILSNEGFRHELIQFCVNRFPNALAPLHDEQ